MKVDHRGVDAFVSQQIFDRQDVQPLFQQMSGVGMPECVDVHRLNNTRFLFSLIHRPLHSSLGIPPVKISACTTNDLLSFTVEQPLNRLFGFQVRPDPTDQ